ncbi:hypothetical protein EMCRGX_G033941 [Ephydatia muelleri]|eukprot:Em0022g307a
MSGLPREVIKWLQSLDLSFPIRNIRRDFSNGYLLAEILRCYYPQELPAHSFSNGTSIQTRLGNWQQIERFTAKQKLNVPKEYMDGTIHCKPGAAHALIERVYTLLTNRELHYLPAKTHPHDFTDATYQTQLPPYARSTAAQSIRTNLATTELTTEPDRSLCKMKAEAIIDVHADLRRHEKEEFPGRFGLKKSKKKVATSEDTTTANTIIDPIIREIKVDQRQPLQAKEPNT